MAAYTDENRICQASTPLGDDVLHLSRMQASEGLSQLFSFQVELVSDNRSVAFEDLIGETMSVKMKLPGDEPRHFHGVIASFTHLGDNSKVGTYLAEMVPWMWVLTRRTNHRIFQEKTTKQILQDVFKAAGIPEASFKLSGTYEPRTYCVQYGETDFEFVSRLMEQEGMYYYFLHEQGDHKLIISDSSSGNPDCPSHAEAKYRAGREVETDEGMLTDWVYEQMLHSGKFSLSDYNFEDPKTKLLKSSDTGRTLGKNSKYELYEYPGGLTKTSVSEAWAKVRMQEQESAAVRARGASGCRGFVPGHIFKVTQHFRSDVEGHKFLLVWVSHSVTQATPYEQAPEGPRYANSFECIPSEVTYRPERRTPKPKIHGSQTAVVVGPSGEEIYTDDDGYGRIKVQFYWDRDGANNESSSCWIRVAQNWAGSKWGGLILPRIGQEVVVSFLEGDPDRPLVTGCVYNADNMPPYDLPADRTQSGFKTRSSLKGGADNFNEIRFEDKKGKEELYIHAEKNRNEVVENDQTVEVGHDQKVAIGNDQTVEIGNDQSLTVKKNRTESVGDDRSLSVGKNKSEKVGDDKKVDVGKNHEESVGKSMTLSVDESRSMSVGKELTETVKGGMILSVSKDRTVSVEGKLTQEVSKDANYKVDGARVLAVAKDSSHSAKTIQLNADDEISLVTGSASITMKKSGDIVIKGKKITVKGSGDVVIKGSKVAQN